MTIFENGKYTFLCCHAKSRVRDTVHVRDSHMWETQCIQCACERHCASSSNVHVRDSHVWSWMHSVSHCARERQAQCLSLCMWGTVTVWETQCMWETVTCERHCACETQSHVKNTVHKRDSHSVSHCACERQSQCERHSACERQWRVRDTVHPAPRYSLTSGDVWLYILAWLWGGFD